MRKTLAAFLLLVLNLSLSAQEAPKPWGSPEHTTRSVVSMQPLAGIAMELPMNEGSGTVAHDISGNGNDATFCTSGGAPAWTDSGISFSEQPGVVAACLDTPLMTWRSIFFFACSYPAAQPNSMADPNANWMSAAGIFGADNTVDGIGFTGSPYGSTFFAVNPAMAYFPNNPPTLLTQGTQLYGGCNTYAVTLGSPTDGTVDHFYVNGVETTYGQWGNIQPNNQGQGAQLAPTSGHYQIGCVGGCVDGLWWEGDIRYFVASNSFYNASGVAAETRYIGNHVQERGSTTFPSGTFTDNVIVTIGDSLTAGYFGTLPNWTGLLETNYGYATTSLGVNKMWSVDMVAMWQERAGVYFSPNAGRQYCAIWAGANDIIQGNQPAARIWPALQQLINDCIAAGGIPILATLTSMNGYDQERDALNQMIYANWKSSGAAALYDLAAIPEIGADGAYANPTYFQPDGIHLTGPNGVCDTTSGYGIVCTAVSATVNQIDAATEAKPRKPFEPIITATRGANSSAKSAP